MIEIKITADNVDDVYNQLASLAADVKREINIVQPVAPVTQTQPAPAAVEPIQPPVAVPTTVPTQQPATAPAPTVAQSYDLNQLSRAAAPLMDGGRQADLIALLQKYGVKALTQLPEVKYGEFATDLRQLGAQI